MYFHSNTNRGQMTFVAKSDDGVSWNVDCGRGPLGRPYFSVFNINRTTYAIAKEENEAGILLRGTSSGLWDVGPRILPRMRHASVHVSDTSVLIVFSRHGDIPERLLMVRCTFQYPSRWRSLSCTSPRTLLIPETLYEGVHLPMSRSKPGADSLVHELRDPRFFLEEDAKDLYLLYAVSGESGIALARFTSVNLSNILVTA
jgi:hypothetical protein